MLVFNDPVYVNEEKIKPYLDVVLFNVYVINIRTYNELL